MAGTVFTSLGVGVLHTARLLTGGTAGLTFLIDYTTEFGFGLVFFVVNLPFYFFAVRKMGWAFTLKTFAAIALLSLISALSPRMVRLEWVQPVYAAVAGGLLIGTGLMILFRHQASLGGVTILATYLQDRFGLRAGYLQLAVDAAVLVGALWVVPPGNVALSLVAAVAMNFVLVLNHKPGRYQGY